MLDISVSNLGSVISFINSTNITVTNFTSYGCTAWQILSSFSSADTSNSHFHVQASSFTNAPSGGIYVTYGNVTVSNTVFDNLEAAPNSTVDTVLHHDNTDGGFLTIRNCTFSNLQSFGTHASNTIGVFRSNLIVTNSRFVNCSAQYAVFNIGNFALLNGSYMSNETATFDNCSFVSCMSLQGTLYMLGKASNPTQQLNLYNTQFSGNEANFGGAVTAFAVGIVQVVGCMFDNNTAKWGLSSFYVYGWVQQVTYFTMHDSKFIGNNGTRIALADPEDTGITDTAECGGLYLSSCKCVGVVSSTFENNIGTGMCVHGQLGSSPDCSGSDPFFFNQTTIAGPDAETFLGIFLDRYDDLVITVDIRRSEFNNNTDAFLTRTAPEPEDVQPIDYLTGERCRLCNARAGKQTNNQTIPTRSSARQALSRLEHVGLLAYFIFSS